MTPAQSPDQSPDQTPAQTDPSAPQEGWWKRNRLALLALLPLAALAVAASSYQYVTLYKPNTLSHVEQASGNSIAFSENFISNKKQYRRDVRITLDTLTPSPAPPAKFAGPRVNIGTATLTLAAKPDVPLDNCRMALIDDQGSVYGMLDKHNMPSPEEGSMSCVPADTPGPQFNFVGDLQPVQGGVRPASWQISASFALPKGRKPAFVRISWGNPNAALIPFKPGK